MTRFTPTKTTDPRLNEGTALRGTPISGFWVAPGEEAAQPDLTELTQRVEALANETGGLRVAIADRPLKYNIHMDDLGDPRYQLLEPFFVLIEEYPDASQVFASVPELEAFADAPNLSEALIYLKDTILDLYDELADTPDDDLGPLPSAWKRILARHVHDVIQ